MKQLNTPLVSIVMITYGHELYIKQAILGVLVQNCNFNIEIIISNDNSPDKTDEIIQEIINLNPKAKNIKNIRHQANMGMMPNFIFALNEAKGKYIALCEGDDFWEDPLKLQKQIDFLESNKDFVMCFHSVTVKNEIEGVNYSYPIPKKNILSFRDILFKHFIPTCSLIFLNDSLPKPLPEWLKYAKMGDIPVELFLADKGKVKFMDEKMAVYRKNERSVTQNIDHIKKGRASYDFLYRNLRDYFGRKYFIIFSIVIFKNRIGYLKDLLGLNPSLKK